MKLTKNGFSLVSLLVTLLLLAVFALLLPRVFILATGSVKKASSKAQYDQQLLLFLQQTRNVKTMEAVLKASVNALPAVIAGRENYLTLLDCFAGKNTNRSCFKFTTLTNPDWKPIIEPDPSSPVLGGSWNPDRQCVVGTDCLLATQTSFTISCSPSKCFSATFLISTMPNPAFSDEEKRARGIPESDLLGKKMQAQFQLPRTFSQPVAPPCTYMGLDLDRNGFLCRRFPPTTECDTSILSLTDPGCSMSQIIRSDSGARGEFTPPIVTARPEDLQGADNRPQVSVRISAFGEDTQYIFNQNDPLNPEEIVTAFFQPELGDRLVLTCPALFTEPQMFNQSPTTITAELIRGLGYGIYRCFVHIINASGSLKGVVGEFNLELRRPPNPDGTPPDDGVPIPTTTTTIPGTPPVGGEVESGEI